MWIKINSKDINDMGESTLRIWLWCMSHARDTDGIFVRDGKDYPIFAGQLISSQNAIAKDVGVDWHTARKALEELWGRRLIDVSRFGKELRITVKNITDVLSHAEEEKVLYGEFVRLTPTEYQKLVTDFGRPVTENLIAELNDWRLTNPKKFEEKKSHYQTLRAWYRKRVDEGRIQKDGRGMWDGGKKLIYK